MNKLILVMVSILILSACNKPPSYTELTGNYRLPEGLKDCEIYQLETGVGAWLNVVRCPNSSTTTQWQAGKMQASATVVEM